MSAFDSSLSGFAFAQCVGCGRRTGAAGRDPMTLVCARCRAGLAEPPPKPPPPDRPEDVQRRLAQMERNDWLSYLGEMRLLDGHPQPERAVYERDEAGYPLGPGMPLGRTQRRDGESHRDAWMRVLRQDPCAYCGRAPAGTLDHIEPRSKPVRGIGGAHCWTNYAGACSTCNGSKSDQPLLDFMLRRVRGAGGRRSTPERAAA